MCPHVLQKNGATLELLLNPIQKLLKVLLEMKSIHYLKCVVQLLKVCDL